MDDVSGPKPTTSTDLRLNLLANHLKINVKDSEEEEESPLSPVEELRDNSPALSDRLERSVEELDLSKAGLEESAGERSPESTPRPRHKEAQRHKEGNYNREAAPAKEARQPGSAERDRYRKVELLRFFHELESRGVRLSSKYTLESRLADMEQEYEVLKSVENKKVGVRLYKGFMLNAVQCLEYMNDTFNPFDFHLHGWSEHVSLGVDDYDDVLGEIYEKYKHSGRRLEPEIKLLIMLTSSAATFHASQTILRDVPVVKEVLHRNPGFVNKVAKKVVEDPRSSSSLVMSEVKGPNVREFLNRMRAKTAATRSSPDTAKAAPTSSVKKTVINIPV